MIAMAMACDPQILIADEPTTALDVTIQAQIFELIERLKASDQTAIMLITHDMGVVAELADDVIVMYMGNIVEQGSVDEVLRFRNLSSPCTMRLKTTIWRVRAKRNGLPMPSFFSPWTATSCRASRRACNGSGSMQGGVGSRSGNSPRPPMKNIARNFGRCGIIWERRTASISWIFCNAKRQRRPVVAAAVAVPDSGGR